MDKIRLLINGEDLDFSENPSVTIVEKNPLLSDGQGSFSYPFSVPLTPKNNRIFKFPYRFQRAEKAPDNFSGELFVGLKRYSVKISIDKISKNALELTASIDTGTFKSVFADKMLADFIDGEFVAGNPNLSNDKKVQNLIDYLSTYGDSAGGSFAMVKDVCLFSSENEKEKFVINSFKNGKFETKASDYIDDNNITKNPLGYGIVPFLRLNFVLRKLFGLSFDTSVLLEDVDSILIVSNAVDAIVRGKIVYSQLVPHTKAIDFIKSIESFFGGKFYIDNVNVEWISYKNLLTQPLEKALDEYLVEDVEFSEKEQEQLVLTHKPCGIKMKVLGTIFEDDFQLDGEIGGELPFFSVQECAKAFYENVTGDNLISTNSMSNFILRLFQNKITVLGLNTLAYDPNFCKNKQEISIEILPAGRLNEMLTIPLGLNWQNTALTAEKSKAKSEELKAISFIWQDQDLSFWANIYYNIFIKTYGRCGIYDTFYKQYDMFLRHAGHFITAKISKKVNLNILKKYALFGQPVIVEEIKNSTNKAYFDVVFRTTKLLEPYNIDDETLQPDF